MTTMMPINLDRVFTDLTPDQTNGWVCVRCAVTFTTSIPSRPVGRSETDSQVFACVDGCADAITAEEVQRNQETGVMLAVMAWFTQSAKAREQAAWQARRAARQKASAALPTPDCPEWCTEGAGHPYRAYVGDGDEIGRTHEAIVFAAEDKTASVTVMQDERVRNGVATLDEPLAYFEGEASGSTTIRAIGRAMCNAAAMVEKIAALSNAGEGAA